MAANDNAPNPQVLAALNSIKQQLGIMTSKIDLLHTAVEALEGRVVDLGSGLIGLQTDFTDFKNTVAVNFDGIAERVELVDNPTEADYISPDAPTEKIEIRRPLPIQWKH